MSVWCPSATTRHAIWWKTIYLSLRRNAFDFDVLMDDGYVRRAGIPAWPTTWFVDRNGYVRFVKTGNTSKLEEEFSWRVEALREETGSP